MKRFIDKYIVAASTITVLFLLCASTVIMVHNNPGYRHETSASGSFLVMKPDSVEEDIIDDYEGIRSIYTFTLPESSGPGMQIRFFLRHTYYSCYYDDAKPDDLTPESNTWHIGHTPGNYWVSVPVHPSLAGRTVHIALTPVYRNVKNEVPVFYYISSDQLVEWILFPQDRIMLTLSIISIAAGLFLSLISFTPDLNGDSRRNIFYMGVTTIFAGIWKLTSISTFLFLMDFTGLQKEIWYVGSLSYLIMLVLSLRLQISLRSDKGNRITRLCFYIGACIAICMVALQITGIIELHDVLVWYGVSMALLHFISIFGNKPGFYELIWLFPFFITMGLDFILYMHTGSIRRAPFFLLWLVINLFIRSFRFISNDIRYEKQLMSKELELKEFRIRAMINEIRPHFIHNTLTSIYILCGEDPEKAQKIIADFTTYLHANFSAISATEPTAFEKELEHVKAYLAVESALYEDRLTIEYDLRYTDFRLPPLTLQPIVENAVKYTVGIGQPQAHITISTCNENGNTLISVTDNGKGFNPPPSSPKDDGEVHVGLSNVRDRLEMMCGGTLEISSGPEGGTVVRICIPSEE